MEQLIETGKRTIKYLCLVQIFLFTAFAQTTPSPIHCQTSSTPLQVRAEGLTERLGDILLQCSSSNSGTVFNANLTVFLPVNVTNRVDAGNTTHDAVVLVDLGSGPIPTPVAGQISGNNIAFNGISYTVPASGTFSIRISNVRAAMNQLGYTSANPVAVSASLSSTLAIDQAQLIVGYSQPGMRASMGSAQISCYGSPTPDTFDMPSLFAAGTALASTRITEGFASAFEARTTGLDNGTRFLVKYSGFPSTTHLYIPDVVAGSGALQPTSGGDLNLPQMVGQYQPGSGALVLVRVQGADATGAGGFAVSPPQGAGPVTLSSVSEVTLTNGSGYAVYEVAAANPAMQEAVQFPTFILLPRFTPPTVADATVSLAPVSNVTTASTTAPVPRFANVNTISDCTLYGDCPVPLAPKLFLNASPIKMSAVAAGGALTSPAGSFSVHNDGGGTLTWNTSIIYQQGSGWLVFDTPSGTNDATVKVTVDTKSLSAGIYQATVIVNAGTAGSQSVPVTLTVTAPTPPPPPAAPPVSVTQVLSAASLQAAPLVPGSLSTLMGTHFSGKNVAVTFDGVAASLLYASDTQINLQVPASLGAKTTASLVVTVDGVSSTAQTVPLAVAWPAVFPHGVFNQDNSENTAAAAGKVGDILQIFATGIPKVATVSAQIGGRKDLIPVYAGEAPTAPGVQQINVAVPDGVTGPATVVVCATTGGQQYCSPGYTITLR
uniref:IPT/TIG domain-containing protein n=1 Tax=Solibacter usitatus (strain Ellin6076) TaxID=234267 RepID=Q02A65_SOLUE